MGPNQVKVGSKSGPAEGVRRVQPGGVGLAEMALELLRKVLTLVFLPHTIPFPRSLLPRLLLGPRRPHARLGREGGGGLGPLGAGLSAPKSRYALRLQRRFLPFPLCPQSPRAKFLRIFCKGSAKNLAIFFADFRPSVSRENGCK